MILLALPFVGGFMLFYLIPLIGALRYSFVESAFDQRFVGWDNYVATLGNSYFRLSVRNTLALIALGVPVLVVAAFCFALLVKERSDRLPVLRAALMLPMLLPSSAVANVFAALRFDDPRVALIMIYVWKNVGFIMFILLAAMSMISRDVYEAAALDGAGRVRVLFGITLPLISGAMLFAAILATAYNLRLFREAYLMFGAYPDDRLYLTQHYMYNHFYKLNYQRLTTASTLFLIVLSAFVWSGLRIVARISGGCDER